MKQQLIEAIQEFLLSEAEMEVNDAVTFEEAGLLTNDEGLVVSLPDGSKFQLTVAKS